MIVIIKQGLPQLEKGYLDNVKSILKYFEYYYSLILLIKFVTCARSHRNVNLFAQHQAT